MLSIVLVGFAAIFAFLFTDSIEALNFQRWIGLSSQLQQIKYDNATCTSSDFHPPHMEGGQLWINHILFEAGLSPCEGGGHPNIHMAQPN